MIEGAYGHDDRQRRRYSTDEKLEVVRFARTHSSAKACAQFHVARSSVHHWIANEGALTQSLHKQTCRPRGRRSGSKTSRYVPLTVPTSPEHDVHTHAGDQQHAEIYERPTSSSSHSATYNLRLESAAVQHEASTPELRSTQASGSEQQADLDQPARPIASNGMTTDPAEPTDCILVGYQGCEHSFAELAASRSFAKLATLGTLPLTAFAVTGYPQTQLILEALAKGEIDFAFVATDALLSDTHHSSLDQLVVLRLQIIGDVTVDEHASACTLDDTGLSDVDCVMSDWATLQKYEDFITQLETQNGSDIHRLVVSDCATGCAVLAEERAEKTLVICTGPAARAHGLNIVQDRVSAVNMHSRYTIVGKCGSPPIVPQGGTEDTATNPPRCRAVLVQATCAALLDVVSAFVYRRIEIERLQTRMNTEGHVRTYLIVYRTSTDPAVERGLRHHLSTAAAKVIELGEYFSDTVT